MKLRHPGVTHFATAFAAFGLLGSLMLVPSSVSAQEGTLKRIADGKLTPPVLKATGTAKRLQSISGSTLVAAVDMSSSSDIRQGEADAASGADIQQLRVSEGTLGCHARDSDGNVRVNQDCTFRGQAEEIIRVNPTDSSNIIGGQNDSRVGYNKCGFDYTFNGGRSWGDGLPPFYQHANGPVVGHTVAGGPGTGHTYDAASDPAETFDSAGRAYFGCIVFDVNSNASGVLVTQSPQGAGGSFYDNVPARGSAFVVVEDNSPTVVHDKDFIAADSFTGSPNRDNVYVTWTVYKFATTCGAPVDGTLQFCSNAIFGSMSTDHAVTWSAPEEISGSSALCAFGNFFDPSRTFNACDLDQGSDPQPTPNGDLVVPFNNANTTTANNQQLAVVCHPGGSSTSGTAHLNCTDPQKVGDDVLVGEPQCDFGRGPEECVPGPFIRANDYPRVALDPASGDVFAVWQDYRNAEYDIQISQSADGGKTWKELGTVNPTPGFDYYMAAVGVGSGSHVAASFYQSDRVPNENSAGTVFAPGMPGVEAASNKSSYWLAGNSRQRDRAIETPFAVKRISPFFAPPDGNQAGFNGDYSGLAVTGGTAHPIWSDTRNSAVQTSPTQGVVHDEDIFTDSVPVPSR